MMPRCGWQSTISVAIIAITLSSGCAKAVRKLQKASNPGAPRGITMRNFSPADSLAIETNRYRIDPSWIVVVDPNGGKTPISSLMDDGYNISIAPIRNPGVLYIFTSRGTGPLLPSDLQIIKGAVMSSEGSVHLGSIPYSFGPDGKTPIITESKTYVSDSTGDLGLASLSIQITFPDPSAADKAKAYIDTSYYTAESLRKGGTSRLTITATIRRHTEFEERDVFEELAKKFGGRVDWVEAGF